MKLGKSNEVWKRIKINGENTVYEVSNLGRVRHSKTHHIKKMLVRPDGYLYVELHVSKKIKKINVHRLVAMAFIPNPDGKSTVNHINGNKIDNTVYNLEWMSQKENVRHAFDNGLNVVKSGFESRHSKYTIDQIIPVIQGLKDGKSVNHCANAYGVDKATIYLIKEGKRYSDICRNLGYIPKQKHQFNITPYIELIVEALYAGKSNKEIREMIPLDISDMQYNYHIRKIKKFIHV